ncbi:MAG: gluconate 2-dehydrogenase subunit 3 family protein [Longimicrobiales bacterium]
MTGSSRRDFLVASSTLLSSAWLTAHLPEIEGLGAAAQAALQARQELKNLSPAEARTVAAFAQQIVPTDATPGAREAGAIYFIDGALGSMVRQLKPVVQEGVRALDAAAHARNARIESFADLSAAQQIRVMKDVQEQQYFNVLRTLVIMGVFADPKHGGNRANAATRIMDFQHQPVYAPPFGYYDSPEKAGRPAGDEV